MTTYFYKIDWNLIMNLAISIARKLIVLILSVISITSLTASAQTLYLIGGALKTCSSQGQNNCLEKTSFSTNAKTHNVYQITQLSRNQITQFWPNNNIRHKLEVAKLLKKLPNDTFLTKSQLANAFKQQNRVLYRNLTNQEYYFVFDMLEVPLLVENKRIAEQVWTSQNNEVASTEILRDIVTELKKQNNKPLYLITASSRDPYESADFYSGLFSEFDINANWLPLTPALAKAISTNTCDQLDVYRNEINHIYNRKNIYPDLIQAEETLCQKGEKHLVDLIENAGALFFNGGDQSLTVQSFKNKAENKEYAWANAIRATPILIGTSAGTAMQAGGKNQFGFVPMITNGSSVNALKNGAFAMPAPNENCHQHGGCGPLEFDSLTYDKQGGLASFTLGALDTHFSERGRTPRLAVLMKATGQKYGFGVDETTSLKVTSDKTLEVIGKNGVVVLEQVSEGEENGFYYHFMPSGIKFSLKSLATSQVNKDEYAPAQVHNRNGISRGEIREQIAQACSKGVSALSFEQGDVEFKVKFTDKTRCEKLESGQHKIQAVSFKL